MPERIAWGALATVLTGGCAAFWRWLIGRKAQEAMLDDSRIGVLSKSWKLQEELTAYWKEQFAALRAEIADLKVEHEACEEKTLKLERQNRDQAIEMDELRREIAALRQQIEQQPRLRAV